METVVQTIVLFRMYLENSNFVWIVGLNMAKILEYIIMYTLKWHFIPGFFVYLFHDWVEQYYPLPANNISSVPVMLQWQWP